jgi:hypothetical protein
MQLIFYPLLVVGTYTGVNALPDAMVVVGWHLVIKVHALERLLCNL